MNLKCEVGSPGAFIFETSRAFRTDEEVRERPITLHAGTINAEYVESYVHLTVHRRNFRARLPGIGLPQIDYPGPMGRR